MGAPLGAAPSSAPNPPGAPVRPEPPRRPRREDYLPVSAAEGSHEGQADPRHPPQRHADFTTWQPPAEEGDDEPILGHEGAAQGLPEPRNRGDRDRDRSRRSPFPGGNEGARPQTPAFRPTLPAAPSAPIAPRPAAPPVDVGARPAGEGAPEGSTGEGGDADADFAEIYVNIGRRDGARAADYQRILTERGGIDRAHVRRIRVRERNAFVSVRREDLAAALTALNGATLANRVAMAEQARERAAEGEGPAEGFPMGAPPPNPRAEGSPAAAAPPAPVAEALPEAPIAAEIVVAPPPAPTPDIPPPEPSDDAVPTGRSRS